VRPDVTPARLLPPWPHAPPLPGALRYAHAMSGYPPTFRITAQSPGNRPDRESDT
jgi:hypothetical protein